MKKFTFFLVALLCAQLLTAQVAINTDGTAADPSAMLDVKSDTAGILVPRMTTAQRTAIASPATGLLVYDTDLGAFWYYNGTAWAVVGSTVHGIVDDDGDTKVDVEDAVDVDEISFVMNGVEFFRMDSARLSVLNSGQSVFIGEGAGANDDLTGNNNVYIGYLAGQKGVGNVGGGTQGNTAVGFSALRENVSGFANTAIGHYALELNTASNNTAVGSAALLSNTTGRRNVAVGPSSLFDNKTGSLNTAIGYHALTNIYSDSGNTAVGYRALYSNGAGYNTAVGKDALLYNTYGTENVAVGVSALYSNTTGNYNVVVGDSALFQNNVGSNNVAVGHYSLHNSTSAQNNVAVGFEALKNNTTGYGNSALGRGALVNNTTGIYNTGVGLYAGGATSTYNNITGIGYHAQPSSHNTVHIGNTSVTWIGGQVTWSTYSDVRIKNNIQEDVKGLDFILRLRPVTYYLDKDMSDEMLGVKDLSDYPEKYDIEKIKMTGFLAQEVAEAASRSGYEFSGVRQTGEKGVYSLSYSQFVVPLVKAVQEQQQTIRSLEEQNRMLKSRLDRLEKRLLQE